MVNHYVDRDAVRSAQSIPASSTGENALLDAALEDVSRLIDQHVGYPLYAHVATKYFTARDSECLTLDTPLLSITALRTDAGGNASYEATWSTGDYWLTGAGKNFNYAHESPPQPVWEIHRRQSGSNSFPAGVERGVEIDATWGRFNQTQGTTATVATAWATGTTDLPVNGATALHAGYTLRVGAEQLFVNNVGTASNIFVERGVNGTSGAAHASAAAISRYTYPVAESAARFQVMMDRRGGEQTGFPGESGESRLAPGGLHPYVRRMLDPLRKPVAG